MKKSIIFKGSLALILIFTLAFVGCVGTQAGPGAFRNEAPMVAGFYHGTAGSFLGPQFLVTVEVRGHEIVNITDNSGVAHHTASMGVQALPILRERVLRNQTVEVDVITGNTITSVFYLEAVRTALQQAGAPQRMFNPTPRSQANVNVDILVVGSGLAGASAAFTARTARPDARVIMIDKQELLGGTSKATGNWLTFPVNDGADRDAWRDHLMMRAQGQADRDIVHRWAFTAREAVSHVFGGSVTPGEGVVGTLTYTGAMDIPRMHHVRGPAPLGVGGPGAGPFSLYRARTAGVIIWPGVEATQLITNAAGDTVTGVRARGNDFGDITFTLNPGGSVILATGGFESNPELMSLHNQDSARDVGTSLIGCGTGIEMGMAIGADTVFKGGRIARFGRASNRLGVMTTLGGFNPGSPGPGGATGHTNHFNQFNAHGMVGVMISQCGAVWRGMPGAVDHQGNPIPLTYPLGSPVTHRDFDTTRPNNNGWQPNHTAAIPVVFDRTIADYGVVHRWMVNRRWDARTNETWMGRPSYNPDFTFWVPERVLEGSIALGTLFPDRGWVFQVPNTNVPLTDPTHPLRVLAPRVGMTPDSLINAWQNSGASVATGPGNDQPWRMTLVGVSSMGSFGGLRINAEAQVIRAANGQPFTALYAAGDVANGQVYYLEYPGSGHGLSLATTFGFIAGRNAAARLPR